MLEERIERWCCGAAVGVGVRNEDDDEGDPKEDNGTLGTVVARMVTMVEVAVGDVKKREEELSEMGMDDE